MQLSTSKAFVLIVFVRFYSVNASNSDLPEDLNNEANVLLMGVSLLISL